MSAQLVVAAGSAGIGGGEASSDKCGLRASATSAVMGGCSIEGETSGCGVKARPKRIEVRVFSLLIGTKTLPFWKSFRHGCISAAE
jgi:hypothetical protein